MEALDIFAKKLGLARVQDLQRIDFSLSQLAGTGNLSPLGRSWLYFLVALVRLGYEGIRAPVGAIVKAQYRAQGRAHSERSAYRGLAELERAGYIHRQKFRIGKNRFSSIIHFKLERFEYWTRGPVHVRPVTPDYINLQLSSWQKTEVSSSRSDVNSPNFYSNDVKEHPRATISKERFKKTFGEKGKKDRREHPIIYSLRMATAGMGKKLRGPVLNLARYELANPKERASGAPWSKWLRKNPETGRAAFEELSIPHEREIVALEQFLPYLKEAMSMEKIKKPVQRHLKKATHPQIQPPEPKEGEAPPAKPEEIKALILAAGLDNVLNANDTEETTPETAVQFQLRVAARVKENRTTGACGLTDNDLWILEAARLRALKAADYCQKAQRRGYTPKE